MTVVDPDAAEDPTRFTPKAHGSNINAVLARGTLSSKAASGSTTVISNGMDRGSGALASSGAATSEASASSGELDRGPHHASSTGDRIDGGAEGKGGGSGGGGGRHPDEDVSDMSGGSLRRQGAAF